MRRCHIKRDDEVVVLSGSEAGSRGKVLKVSFKKQRALVEGLKMIKRHQRKSQQNPQGKIVEREGSIHISKLMLAEEYDRRRSGNGNQQEKPANG
jgi:large subunit ribosomal protein L24